MRFAYLSKLRPKDVKRSSREVKSDAKIVQKCLKSAKKAKKQ